MYNPALKTFITVATCGSFTRAADTLFLSATAVMKQINALERELHLTLFTRTRHGVTLTPGGSSLLPAAQFIIGYADSAIAAARALSHTDEQIFCVGTSLLNPARAFMELWYQVEKDFSDYRLHIIPYEDTHGEVLAEISALGEKFDFIVAVNDSKIWRKRARFLPLGGYRAMIAMSQGHPLASRTKLTLADLAGETMMMVPPGDSSVNDSLRAEITARVPGLKLVNTPRFYDMTVFNKCATSDKLLLSLECWQDVHPGLVTRPIELDYRFPYGLLYALEPSAKVAAFVAAVEKLTANQPA